MHASQTNIHIYEFPLETLVLRCSRKTLNVKGAEKGGTSPKGFSHERKKSTAEAYFFKEEEPFLHHVP